MDEKTGTLNLKAFTAGVHACRAIFLAGILYALIAAVGLSTLPDQQTPVGDPWFTLMELLTILSSLLMVFAMGTIHIYARSWQRAHSMAAFGFMIITATITTANHFVILVLNHQAPIGRHPAIARMLRFKWPSIAYILDIAAWDLFFPLAMAQGSVIFSQGRQEKSVRLSMMTSAILSFSGLLGVPSGNMALRNIGIIGYAVAGPVSFLMIGKLLIRSRKAYECRH